MQVDTLLEKEVRAFILTAFLDAQSDTELTDDTNLVELAIVDSINVLRLVEFMEEGYDIMLEPQELHRLLSINDIATVIREKQAS